MTPNKSMRHRFFVVHPSGVEETHHAHLPEYATTRECQHVAERHLGVTPMHMTVELESGPADLFFDPDGHARGLPNNKIVHRRMHQVGGQLLPEVFGRAIIFEKIVYPKHDA